VLDFGTAAISNLLPSASELHHTVQTVRLSDTVDPRRRTDQAREADQELAAC
jgi:hypothetical protein